MSISAFSISEDSLPDGRSLDPLTDLGALTIDGKLKKDVNQGWIANRKPPVTRAQPPA